MNNVEKIITLNEYCTSVRDGTHDSPKSVLEGKFLITSKHINNNSIDFSSAYKISDIDYQNINKRSKVDKWDLLMSMIGTVGRLYVVKENPNYAIKNLALFKIGDEWRAKYLYYYLGSKPVQDYFAAVANGTSQHFVGLGYLRKFKIPDWNENTLKIIKTLDKYDQLIENNNRRIKILEDMAESLYKEWFVRFRFPGHENAEFENGIPKGWNIVKAGEKFNITIGKTPPRAESQWFTESYDEVDWSSIADMRKGIFLRRTSEQLTHKAVEKFNMVKLPKRTILVSFKLTVGQVAITSQNITTTNEAIAHFVCNDEEFEYLYMLLKNYNYKELGNTSSIGNAVNSKIIKKMNLMFPDKKLLHLYHCIIKEIFDYIEVLYNINGKLIQERDALLPRLMSGKLKVTGGAN